MPECESRITLTFVVTSLAVLGKDLYFQISYLFFVRVPTIRSLSHEKDGNVLSYWEAETRGTYCYYRMIIYNPAPRGSSKWIHVPN